MSTIPNFERQREILRAYKSSLVADYIALGWRSLFPLCSPGADGACCYAHNKPHEAKDTGKVPLVPWKGLIEEPPTRQELDGWFRRWPDANIGLALAPAKLVVVDLDSEEAIDEAQQLGLPDGPRVWTGARPKHHYFDRGDLQPVRAIKQGRSRKIDILSDGYIVLAPSLHRTLRVYEWGPPPSRRLPSCPGWVAKIIREHSQRTGSPKVPPAGQPLPDAPPLECLAVPAHIRDLILYGPSLDWSRYASRSEAVFAVAASLVRAGYPDHEIAAVLLDAGFAISEKPRAQGVRWVWEEVARVRAKVGASEMSPQTRVWKFHVGAAS